MRKLVEITKPGKPIIIVYSNPETIVSRLVFLARKFHLLKKRNESRDELYFYAHPIEWWDRFQDISSVLVLPWRSFSSNIQKIIIPNSKIGQFMLAALFHLEDSFPNFFVKHFQYPMIILIKNKHP